MPRVLTPKWKTWVFTVILSLILLGFSRNAKAGMEASTGIGRSETARIVVHRAPEPVYQVQPGMHGDVFPAFANFESFQQPSERQWGVVTVKVTNPTDRLLTERIAVRVLGWSDEEVQILEIGAGQVRQLQFAPTFLPRFYENHEIAAATARVSITDMGGHPLFSTTVPVRLRSVDDIYWGRNFKHAQFIASWVTPHDPQVESVLSLAKEFMPGRRLPGYETWKAASAQKVTTYAQASAIYRALQKRGLSYVKSSLTLGAEANAAVAERVRMPRESIREVSANCIDGAVLYASLFENLGMDPVIVLVPGHAYVGVRVAQNSPDFLYIETALTGRASFQRSVRAAARGLAKIKPGKIIQIPIAKAREAGIYPMPLPGDMDASVTTFHESMEGIRRP